MRKLKKKPVVTNTNNNNEPLVVSSAPEVLDVRPSVPKLIDPEDPFWAANQRAGQVIQDLDAYRWEVKLNNYYNKFRESKKTDKIEPLETLPVEAFTPELEDELKQQGFFINKTDKEVQLYPADVIQTRIIDNGFKEQQFSKYWGIDPKQIKTEFKDVFKAADQQYEATVLNKVLNESVKTGKSPEEVFNTLGKSWGVTSELKNKYLKKSQDELSNIIKQAQQNVSNAAKAKPLTEYQDIFENSNDPQADFNSQYYQNPDGSPNWERIKAAQEREDEAIKSNPVKSYFNLPSIEHIFRADENYFDNKGTFYDAVMSHHKREEAIKEARNKPYNEALQAYVGNVGQDIFANNLYNQTTNALANNDFKKQAEILKNLQDNNTSAYLSNQDYENYFNWQDRQEKITQGDPFPKQISTWDKVADAALYPFDAFAQGSKMWDNTNMPYRDRKEVEKAYGIDMGTDKTNLVGNALNTFNPLRFGYESAQNIAGDRYGDFVLDALTVASPLYTGKVLSGLNQAGKAVVNYAPIKSAPWLNLQNAVINPYFAYESVKPGGLFEEAYHDFSKDNIGSGLVNTAFGVMGVMPYISQPLAEAKYLYNTLNTPGTKTAILPKAGKYAASYKAPNTSELYIGDPTLENAVPAFEAITKPFNRLGYGELNIMKQPGVASKAASASEAASASSMTEPLQITANSVKEAMELYKQGYRMVTQDGKKILGNPNIGIPNEFNTRGSVTMIKDAPERAAISSVSAPTETELATNQQIANTVNELKQRKVEFWSTPEGERRLQYMIDNTPGLENVTPKDYVNLIKDINVVNEDKMFLESHIEGLNKKLAEEQTISLQAEANAINNPNMFQSAEEEQQWWAFRDDIEQGLQKQIQDAQEQLNVINEKGIPFGNAYYDFSTNSIGIGNNFSKGDLQKASGHEITHPLSAFNSDKKRLTTFDKELEKLELIDEEEASNRFLKEMDPVSRQTSLDFNEPSGANNLFGRGYYGDDYYANSIDYWKTGTEGGEKAPFLAEIREDLLEKGVIKSEGDKITPELLRKHFNSYMNERGEKYPLRLYDIMTDTKKNFKLLSKVINNLPVVGATALAADAVMGDNEDNSEQLSEAALLGMLGKFGKSSKKVTDLVSKIKAGKNVSKLPVVKAINELAAGRYKGLPVSKKKALAEIFNKSVEMVDIMDKGYETYYNISHNTYRFNEKNIKKLLDKGLIKQESIDKLVKVFDTVHPDSTITDPIKKVESALRMTTYQYPPTKEGFIVLDEQIREYNNKIFNLQYKLLGRPLAKADIKVVKDERDRLEKSLNELKKLKKDFELINENQILTKSVDAEHLENALNLNDGIVTNFKTGKKINTTATMPSVSMINTLTDVNGSKEVIKEMQSIKGGVDPVYRENLTSNIESAKETIPGAQPFGSSLLVSELGISHITNDIDMMVIDTDFAKVKNKFKHEGPNGPAEKYNVFPKAGQEGILDINIIKTGPDGLALYDPTDQVSHALQVFRQFWPELYQKAALEALETGNIIKIPLTPQQLMERYNPLEKTVMDAYEAEPYGYTKEKHRYRPDVIISFADEAQLSKVASAQEKYIKSLVGPNGQLAKQFSKESLSNSRKNLEILNYINYPGNRAIIAKSPERMQLAINDWYIHNSSFTRKVNVENLVIKQGQTFVEALMSAYNDWIPGQGGSFRGIGLNNQQIGPLDHTGSAGAHKQLNIISDITDPLAYIKDVDFKLGNANFTPEQTEQINKIYEETLGKFRKDYFSYADEKDWNKASEILDRESGKSIDPHFRSSEEQQALVDFLNKLESDLGLRALKSAGNYDTDKYASTLSKIDDAIDAIMITQIKLHVQPKSYDQRVSRMNINNTIKDITNAKDFIKIKNLLLKSTKTTEDKIEFLGQVQANINSMTYDRAKRMIERKFPELTKDVKTKEELIKKLNNEAENNTKIQIELNNRIRTLANVRANSILIVGALTALSALGSIAYMEHLDSKRDYEKYEKEQAFIKDMNEKSKLLDEDTLDSIEEEIKKIKKEKAKQYSENKSFWRPRSAYEPDYDYIRARRIKAFLETKGYDNE